MSTVAHQHDLDAARAEIAALKERLDALERQVAFMLNEASAWQTAAEIMAQPYKPRAGGTLP